ncbi:MAG TPA: GyrI-like domain-containing protein [Chitinophagaceae bacterium]|nr:GyrI-like domain-containing protein [Chitinophagaceae bacterium]
MIEPEIRIIGEKKLVGKRMSMSLAADKTHLLWKSFMPLRNQVVNKVNADLISLRAYPSNYFEKFDPGAEYEKWALVEVEDFVDVPEEMETYILPGGMYAVFHYKGADNSIFQFIYGEWISNSGYALDDRPHFEILGEKYRNGDPDSEEEIWIPIADKKTEI